MRIELREDMSKKYRDRVTKFVKEVSKIKILKGIKMENQPIVLNDQFAKKQIDKYLSPIKASPDVTLKHFKYNSNHNDKERIRVSLTNLLT